MAMVKCKVCNWYEHDDKYPTCFHCSGVKHVERKIDISKIPGCPIHPVNIALNGFGGWACDCEKIKRQYLKKHRRFKRAPR